MDNGVIFIISISENTPFHNLEIPNDWTCYGTEMEVLLLPNFHFIVT